MNKNSKIFVAGGTGLVGSSIIKQLLKNGYTNIISTKYKRKAKNRENVTFYQLDLRRQKDVENFFEIHKPEYVFLAAAKVGGILANNIYRADFIYENLAIQTNVIHSSYIYNVKKLLFLGSSCIYPRNSPQPIKEEYLLTNELEYTNEPYAIAKIAGIKMCESYNLQYGTNFISVMPTNLYGENDNFDLEKSHVLPALIRKIYLGRCLERNEWDKIKIDLNKRPIEGVNGNYSENDILRVLEKYGIKQHPESKKVIIEIWGSGKPRREFLYSGDLADACIFLMENINFNDIVNEQSGVNKSCEIIEHKIKEIRNTHINIGTGQNISIKDLANLIKNIINYNGEFYFNKNKPDGTMIKVNDVSKIHSLGWKHKIELQDGIKKLYEWYSRS